MTDCIIDVTIVDASAIDVAVTIPGAVDVQITNAQAVDVAVSSATAVAVEVVAATAVSVDVQAATAVDVALTEPISIDVEIVDMSGISGLDKAKLDSIDWGARADRDFQCLAYVAEYDTRTGTVGDSNPFTGTSNYQEVCRVYISQPSWRGQGIVSFDATALFYNSTSAGATGNETMSFRLYAANVANTEPTASQTSTFGLPEATSTVATFQTTKFNQDPDSGTRLNGIVTFNLRIRAAGHTSSTFSQVGAAVMTTGFDGTGGVTVKGQHALMTLDPTNDMYLALAFKTDYAPSTNRECTLLSAAAFFEGGR